MSQQKGKRTKFTPVEDQLLLQLINIYGKKDWNEIANHLIDRTPKQCRNRFQTYLSPVKALHPWPIEEDEKLTMLVQTRAPHFDDFYEHFPERTVSNLKNRWYIHLGRKEISGNQTKIENHQATEIENQRSLYFMEDSFQEILSEQFHFYEFEMSSESK
jgi:hypothetical protein